MIRQRGRGMFIRRMDCIDRIRLLIVCRRIRRGGDGGLNSSGISVP